MSETVVNSLEEIIIVFTKATFERLLREKDFEKLWTLYSFYAYTSKWQGTNQPRATVNYVAKGLSWDRKKVMRYRLRLKALGLIEDVVRKGATGKVKGNYVKINYILNLENTKDILVEIRKKFHSTQNGDIGKTAENFHSPDIAPGGETGSVVFSPPNALYNKEMLKTNILNAEPSNKKFYKAKQNQPQKLDEIFRNIGEQSVKGKK